MTNRNAEIRVVDLVLGLDLEMTVVLVPKLFHVLITDYVSKNSSRGASVQCTIKIVILKKSFSEKTALSRMAMKSSSSELGRWVDRVSA